MTTGTRHGPDQEPRPGRRNVILGALTIAATSACSTGPSTVPPTTPPASPAAPSDPPTAEPPTAKPPPAPAPTTGSDTTTAPGLGDPGPDIVTGPRYTGRVALTFHGAGDPTLTARALDIARSHGAQITVFAVGQWLAATPSLGRDITAAGHDLGNHTWSHPALATLTLADATREIRLGADAVTRSIGSPGLLFRPSGTPTSTPTIRAAAAASGYARCISYDVDPLDYTDPGGEAVRTRTLASATAGSIVSLHLGHPGTIDALPGILEGLATRNLTAVTLTRMLTPLT